MVMALEVHCSPVVEEFEQPVEIDIFLPPPTTTTTTTTTTTNQLKFLSLSGLGIRLLRHLAVARVTLDPFRIAQIAMRSLVTEPVVLQICVFAEIFQDDSSAHPALQAAGGAPSTPPPSNPRTTPLSPSHTWCSPMLARGSASPSQDALSPTPATGRRTSTLCVT